MFPEWLSPILCEDYATKLSGHLHTPPSDDMLESLCLLQRALSEDPTVPSQLRQLVNSSTAENLNEAGVVESERAITVYTEDLVYLFKNLKPLSPILEQLCFFTEQKFFTFAPPQPKPKD